MRIVLSRREGRGRWLALAAGLVGLWFGACQGGRVPPPTRVAGAPAPATAKALAAGADVLQEKPPVDRVSMVLAGFHPMLDAPNEVMTAFHYCAQVNADVTQCSLFDGNTANANLIGVEYIVSERLFQTLPAEEQKSWHPHNYEILSGLLVMPGLPDELELRTMRRMLNSYGKTWHTWAAQGGQSSLPTGEARLAWSFNADGEIPSSLVNARDAQLQVDTARKRAQRARLVEEAHPQMGVNRLAEAFPGRRLPEGVREPEGTPAAPAQ